MTDPFFSNQDEQDNKIKSSITELQTDQDDPDPDIYIPEIKKEEVLKIEGTDYDSRLDSVMDSNGFIKTRINEDVIIQRISHDLYKDSDSGLRELYNNEVRACQIARDKFNQNPYIKVSLNQIDRKLIIQGFNSLGITEKIFTKVLLVLGNSGNLDSKAIGQFGMGFASYTTLSDIMLLQTRCLENTDCYSVMAKGGLGFQKLPKPHLEQSGTKLSLTLRENCDHNNLVKMLIELAHTSGIKTYLELILDTDKNSNVQGFKSGIHELKQTSFKEMFEELNSDQTKSYIKTSLVNEDIEIYLAISANKHGSIDNNKKKKVFLCNSPIEAKLSLSDYSYNEREEKESEIDRINYSSVVINLRDERKFKPMPERERLTKEAEIKIKEIIIDLYNNAIQKGIKPCHDFNSWFDHEHKNFIVTDNETITRNFDKETKELSKLLNTNVFQHDPEKRKTKYDYVPLKNIVEKRSKYNFFIEKRDKRIKGLLNEFRSGHNLVVLSPNHRPYINQDQEENENRDTFAKAKNRLMKFGFIEAKQYLIDNKIKATRLSGSSKQEKLCGMISIHHTVVSSAWHDRGTLKDSIETIDTEIPTYEKMKDKIIMVKPFADYRRLTREFNSKFYLTVDKKELGLKTPYDIETEIANIEFNTNQGKKTLSEIIKHKKESDIIKMNNECCDLYDSINDPKNKSIDEDKAKLESKLKVLDYIPKTTKENNILYIIDSVDNLFKLGIVLIANKINYEAVNESLDYYYRSKVEQFEKTIRLHSSNDIYSPKTISRHCFVNIFEFEDYLLTLKNLEDTIKNQTLLKLFKLSRTEHNYKELAKDVLELNKKCS